MRLLWQDQPRVTLKVAVYLTDVESPDDGALEVVPRSHLDTASRHPAEDQPDGLPILGPAGTVAMFDARLWHRRRDNLGTRIRRAMFMAYSYRWLTSRDTPFEDVPAWANLSPVRRQLLGDKRSTRSTGPPAAAARSPLDGPPRGGMTWEADAGRSVSGTESIAARGPTPLALS